MNLFQRKSPGRAAGYRRSAAVTIRWATPADAANLADLAQLDEASVPESPVLLAFVGDELWVAASLSTGATVADPFRATQEVAALVRERGRQLAVTELGLPRAGIRRARPGWAR
jgi:hypothetical protein